MDRHNIDAFSALRPMKRYEDRDILYFVVFVILKEVYIRCNTDLDTGTACAQAVRHPRQRGMKRVTNASAYSTQAPGDKQVHNERQAGIFNSKTERFTAPLPEDVKQASNSYSTPAVTQLRREGLCIAYCCSLLQRLARIVDAVPDLGPDSRILDVGSGTGCLIPFLRNRGVQDILAVDLSANMLARVRNVNCQR